VTNGKRSAARDSIFAASTTKPGSETVGDPFRAAIAASSRGSSAFRPGGAESSSGGTRNTGIDSVRVGETLTCGGAMLAIIAAANAA